MKHSYRFLVLLKDFIQKHLSTPEPPLELCGRALVQKARKYRNRTYITRDQPFVLHSRPLFSSAFTAKEGLEVSIQLIYLQNRGYIRNPTFCYTYSLNTHYEFFIHSHTFFGLNSHTQAPQGPKYFPRTDRPTVELGKERKRLKSTLPGATSTKNSIDH